MFTTLYVQGNEPESQMTAILDSDRDPIAFVICRDHYEIADLIATLLEKEELREKIKRYK